MSLKRPVEHPPSYHPPRFGRRSWGVRLGIVLALLPLNTAPVASAADTVTPAAIAIIIDDLGNNEYLGRRAAQLPGPVACAILPHTRYASLIAEQAHRQKKEVLLHLPMESSDTRELGPGNLLASMPLREVRITLELNLESVPHVAGINNHMGSQYTQDPEQMEKLMQLLHAQHQQLFFVDSLTTADSLVAKTARRHQVPYLVRDVFLDNERTAAAIERQFEHLLVLARDRGYALGIGHPYRETLAVLEQRLPELDKQNIKIIPLSSMLAETTPWLLSSSP